MRKRNRKLSRFRSNNGSSTNHALCIPHPRTRALPTRRFPRLRPTRSAGKFLESPCFAVDNVQFFMRLYPAGDGKEESKGHVSAYLHIKTPEKKLTVDYEIAVLNQSNGLMFAREQAVKDMGLGSDGQPLPWAVASVGSSKFIAHTRLTSFREEVLRSSTMIITARLTTSATEPVQDFRQYIVVPPKALSSAQHTLFAFPNLRGVLCRRGLVPAPCGGASCAIAHYHSRRLACHKQQQHHHPFQSPVLTLPPSSPRADDLAALLASGEGSDVKFVVGDTSFRVHRIILSARSPVFRAMLQGPGKGTIAVEDVEPVVFQAVLRYLYTEGALRSLLLSFPLCFVVPSCHDQRTSARLKYNVMRCLRVRLSPRAAFHRLVTADLEGEPGPELAQHLLVAADRFKIDRLRLLMEQQLCATLDVKSAAHVLLLADQHNATDLKRAASAFVALNAQAVMATSGWEQLCSSRPKLLSEVMRAMVRGAPLSKCRSGRAAFCVPVPVRAAGECATGWKWEQLCLAVCLTARCSSDAGAAGRGRRGEGGRGQRRRRGEEGRAMISPRR